MKRDKIALFDLDDTLAVGRHQNAAISQHGGATYKSKSN